MSIDTFLDPLALEQIAPDRYRAANADISHNVVFGGQLLGQTILAALAEQDEKSVKTVHTVFARSASPDAPVEITVDRMHSGRAFASSSVTISQGDRLCARSIVLLTAAEPDLIRHADPMPVVPGPDECEVTYVEADAWEVKVVGGVDVNDPEAVGPAELEVWTRFVGAPDDPPTNQALVAYATDGFLIGTAMRPHAGVGQSQAHKTISTGVISHTLTFHEPCSAAEWLLYSHRSPYAGRGRCYGRANVYRAGGELVASFVQDAMIRGLSPGTM